MRIFNHSILNTFVIAIIVTAGIPTTVKAQDEFVMCKEGYIGKIPFVNNRATIAGTDFTNEGYSKLLAAAKIIKANPDCKVKIIGHSSSSKASQQLSWERVNAVVKYFTEKQGISEKRIIFSYGVDGDENSVKLNFTTEDGPNVVPAPFPYLRPKEQASTAY